ncbi:condensation domain-containing protein, partial [Salinispira pacifica]
MIEAMKPSSVVERAGPLLSEQKQIWFRQAIEPQSVAYNRPFALRIALNVSPGEVASAIGRLVDRHEVLRTTYRAEEGTIRQHVQEGIRTPFQFVDLSSVPVPMR